MRFSLLSLMLACLTLGSLLGVYVLNGPWQMVRTFATADDPELRKLAAGDFKNSRLYLSPDNERYLNPTDNEPRAIYVYAELKKGGRPLFIFPAGVSDFSFINDELIFATKERGGQGEWSVWRRRYPEWWWGNLLRPEVWAAVVFGGLWMWRIWKWVGEKRKTRNA